MAVFVARKCACGGKLEYDPNKKVWTCKYCGTVVEREATFDKVHVDGIEGVSDIVRQTLMDVASQRMDSARKNLEDCERKGHKHIGTLLANLSYNLANVSCARTQDEARGSVDKVKILSARLKQEFPTIAEDEINLYEEFGDDAGDIFANLMVVFDTLGDVGRVDFVSTKLQPEKVFSPHANRTLLKVAIRRKEYDVVDKIIGNVGHIDRKTSLQEVMEHYPSTDEKKRLIRSLFQAETAAALSKKFFEGYFATVKDSLDVKSEVVKLLNTTDIHVSAESIVKNAQEELRGYTEVRQLFDAIFEVKVSDQEIEALLAFCLMVNKDQEVQDAFFDSLIEKKVFVALSARAVISYLDDSRSSGEVKAGTLGKMLGFNLDAKALDAVYNHYLNDNDDDVETRERVLDVLLVPGSPISTGTVKTYVVRTRTDGERKRNVIEKMFATGINKAYVGDLLSDYVLHTSDPEPMKGKVTDYLIKQGFKADSSALTQYITSTGDSVKVKVERARQLVQNGTQIKADAIDAYLLAIRQPDEFSEEMFDLLTSNSYVVSLAGYTKFLLSCKDADKVRHHEKLLRAVNGDVGGQSVSLRHNGNKMNCSPFQAYLLNAPDSPDVAGAIVSQFHEMKLKLNTDVTSNGTSIRFKKYVGENKDALSPLAFQLCEENKMFSFF